eukprot:GGOE01004916.1.p4 GENE.GGOE01004916.1~~GGOE01004916.1.p4  ORF type:complete len:129 (+),score=10.58 GGOE01004916.1:668-1054(+)
MQVPGRPACAQAAPAPNPSGQLRKLAPTVADSPANRTPLAAPEAQRWAMLAAAEARLATAPAGISASKAQELAAAAQKRELVGRVVAQLQRIRAPEPMGLHAMSVPALQELLQTLSSRKPVPPNLVRT